MSEIHKVITVYGNSGSYKTSVAVSLAKAITEIDKEASISVIGLDTTKPLIPLVLPGKKTTASLGKLMSIESLDQEAILKNFCMFGKIGFLGYNSGENSNSYANPIAERIDDFITQMRHLCNYTIIDCNSHVTQCRMTAKALIDADDVIYLLSADINGLVFYNSQEPILLSEQYSYGSFAKYLTLHSKFIEDVDTLKGSIPGIKGVIPYSDKLPAFWNNGEALQDLPDGKYNNAIFSLAESLMED